MPSIVASSCCSEDQHTCCPTRGERRSGIRKEASVVHDPAELLTVREVARQLRVDDTTVRRWIKNGVLEAISLPHKGARQAYRIRRSTLNTLLDPSTQPVSH